MVNDGQVQLGKAACGVGIDLLRLREQPSSSISIRKEEVAVGVQAPLSGGRRTQFASCRGRILRASGSDVDREGESFCEGGRKG